MNSLKEQQFQHGIKMIQEILLKEVLIMDGINIYNIDGKVLTSKMINEIRKIINRNKNENENITLIIQGGVISKVKK